MPSSQNKRYPILVSNDQTRECISLSSPSRYPQILSRESSKQPNKARFRWLMEWKQRSPSVPVDSNSFPSPFPRMREQGVKLEFAQEFQDKPGFICMGGKPTPFREEKGASRHFCALLTQAFKYKFSCLYQSIGFALAVKF